MLGNIKVKVIKRLLNLRTTLNLTAVIKEGFDLKHVLHITKVGKNVNE